MLRRNKPQQVSEYEARGEIERVYHDIQQTLRVTGVNLNFRTWAGYGRFLPEMWEAVRPNAETRAFEAAADRLRAEAVQAAEPLGRLDVFAGLYLGESQAYQIRAALALYHYINPKLLVLTSAVRLALHRESIGRPHDADAPVERIQRGAPATMYPLDMTSEKPEDERLQLLFDDIKQTLALSSINSDYRTLALWPDYLETAWARLKSIVQHDTYGRAADELRQTARSLASALPYPVPLSRQQVEELGEDADEVTQTTERFETLLPGLIINMTLCALDWHTPEALMRSPFPAATRGRL